MTTTYLANGDTDPEDIIRSVKKGVYCASFSGGQVDISNGDFVFVPTTAWLVEDGRFSHPIKNFTLIGNGSDAMSKISMVGMILPSVRAFGPAEKTGKASLSEWDPDGADFGNDRWRNVRG